MDEAQLLLRLGRLEDENERLTEEHRGACILVAQMHAAAMGRGVGPERGVVEDIADLRINHDRLSLENERLKAAASGLLAAVRDFMNLAAIRPLPDERASVTKALCEAIDAFEPLLSGDDDGA